MNKYFLLSLLILSACTSAEEILNKEYVGKEVYVCNQNYSLSLGKKTIQKVTVHSSHNIDDESEQYGYYTINFVDSNGYYEAMSFNNIKQELMEKPFCSASGYKKLEAEKQKAQAEVTEKQNDCEQAVENAYNARKKLPQDIKMFNGSDTINLKKEVVEHNTVYQVIDTASTGIIVSNNCELIQNAGDALTHSWAMDGILSAAGHFVKTLCQEETIFIYTSQTDYATNERFRGNDLIYVRDGTYGYKGKIIKAYRAGSPASQIEYKTYLKNKQLKCCRENDKTKVCN